MAQTAGTAPNPIGDEDSDPALGANGTLQLVEGIGPRDALETMLAAQMVAIHNAMMDSCRRALVSEQPPEAQARHLNAANKLARTFAAQTEALNKHRGKGQQKVTVEHVHVHEGGQAIVGHVEHGGGRGEAQKPDKQPHAIADSPEPSLRCAYAEGDAVPIASGSGKEAVPDARRRSR